VRKTPELVDDNDTGGALPDEMWMVAVEGSPSRFPLLAKFGIALGTLVLLFISALALGPMVLPGSVSAPYAERFISRITGAEVRINGDHSFSILPSLRLRAENVISADPTGPFDINLPYLEVEISSLGALSGSVDLERVILRDPAVQVRIGAMAVAAAPVAPEIDHAWGWWRDMSLRELMVENAYAVLTDKRSGRVLKLESFNVSNALFGEGKAEDGLLLNGAGTLNGKPIKLALNTSDPQLLVSGNRWPFELSIISALLNGSFKGSIAVRERTVGEGDLLLSGDDVAALNAWIGPLMPARSGGALALKAKIDGAGNMIDVRRLDLQFGVTSLTGRATLRAVTSGAPVIEGRFEAQTLDLGAAQGSEALAVAEAPLMIPGMPSGKIELSWLRALWHNVVFGAGNATMERPAGTHRLRLSLDGVDVYGGKMRGSFNLDASEGMRALNVEGRAVGVSIGPLLSAVAAPNGPILSGKSTIELNLFSVGGTSQELMQALTGGAEVVAQDGELTITELVNGLVPDAGPSLKFKSLNGQFTVAQGIAVSDDLLLQSGDLSLVGRGRLDLANWTIDLNVGRLGTKGDERSLRRYRVSGPAADMRVEPINGS